MPRIIVQDPTLDLFSQWNVVRFFLRGVALLVPLVALRPFFLVGAGFIGASVAL